MKKVLFILNIMVVALLMVGCVQSQITAETKSIETAPIRLDDPIPVQLIDPTPAWPADPTPTVLPQITELPRSEYPDSNVPLNDNGVRPIIALRAATLAAETMPGPYSWEEFRSCSSFASAYLRQLSFPVNGLNGENASHPDPFPFSGVINQIDWFRRNYPQYIQDAPLRDFLEGKLWNQIHPGDLVYFQTAIGHNGYNTYYHVAVFIGMKEDSTPQFAEIAAGMRNVSVNRSFEQTTSFYSRRADGSWAVDGYADGSGHPVPTLMVTWVDPLAILNKGSLWRQNGIVIPNSQIFIDFDRVVTINIEDGTLSIFQKSGSSWEQVSLNGRTQFFSVVGRRLPANSLITQAYNDQRSEIYDGDFGVLISKQGVYQDTWTPQFMARLTGFEKINNFGGIGGSTDTSLLVPLVYNNKGGFVDFQYNSNFTFHLIPNVINQDMLLREDLLKVANDPTNPSYGPVPKPAVYLSSGCVNFDKETWAVIKTYLQDQLDVGNKIAVVFSYPNFDQNLLPSFNIFEAPFTGRIFYQWCPEKNENNLCDPYDRRGFRQTYLDQPPSSPTTSPTPLPQQEARDKVRQVLVNYGQVEEKYLSDQYWQKMATDIYLYGQAQRILVLEYHGDNYWMYNGAYSMTPESLKHDMRWLMDNNYHFVTGAEMLGFLEGWLDLPTRSIFLTTDSGAGSDESMSRIIPLFQTLEEQYGYPPHMNSFIWTQAMTAEESIHCKNDHCWETFRQVRDSGFFTIGTHTESHNDFEKTMSAEWTEQDLTQSMNEIADSLDLHVYSLTWPYESCSVYPDTVSRVGIKYAFGGWTREPIKLYAYQNDNLPLCLPRLFPPNPNGVSGRPAGLTLPEMLDRASNEFVPLK